jgi:RNA polymerase sigma factor (sigma-70 family)
VLSFRQQQPRTGQDTLTPQVILEGEEFKARLTAAIADLPEGQRTVFLLNRTEQKTYKEIAELLGISVKAVEKRMHKALLNLRQVAREGE